MVLSYSRPACAVFIAIAAAGLGAWQDRRPAVQSGIAIYQDAEYEGRTRTFTVDVPNLGPSGFNDRISSFVVAPGETWELCVDPQYRGECTVITDREPNLQDSGWNDRISSMRRLRTNAGVQPFGGRGRAVVNPTLELFAGTSYSGQRKIVSEPIANFSEIDFNDRALSVRVRGDWELCVNADFDDCRVVSANTPNLNTLGLARLISSARPWITGRGGRLPQPRR